jgi:hypothetical protein
LVHDGQCRHGQGLDPLHHAEVPGHQPGAFGGTEALELMHVHVHARAEDLSLGSQQHRAGLAPPHAGGYISDRRLDVGDHFCVEEVQRRSVDH